MLTLEKRLPKTIPTNDLNCLKVNIPLIRHSFYVFATS
jgi:hypothetical protein